MLPSLSQSPDTFTENRVREILHNEVYRPESHESGYPSEFQCHGMASHRDANGTIYSFNVQQREKRAMHFSKVYHSVVKDPIAHCSRLDAEFSKLLECNFRFEDSDTQIVEDVCQLLSRLPAYPIPMPHAELWNPNKDMSKFYFVEGSTARPPADMQWEDLRVVAFVSTNVIRLSLMMAMAGETFWAGIFRRYIDTIAELLEASYKLSKL